MMMSTKAKFHELIEALFEMVQTYEDAPSWALALKLTEEVGEFHETVLQDNGYLEHKPPKLDEDLFYEAADIINVLIGFLAVRFQQFTPTELAEMLYSAIATKGDKYADVLRAEEIRLQRD